MGEKSIAISVKNVTKTYRLYDSHADRVKETFHPFRKKYHQPFNALDNVSFEVKKGETLGIIGRNGSGKSTLLQILCGILQATSGSVEVNGRVSALLELGAGFNPEFTGRQNVYINGAILGLKHDEIEARFDDITTFADIGDFIGQPVKTYSSGMYVRLAFSVAINVDPDILFVDEALAVGDIRFQQKCLRRMHEFREKGSVILVSHDMGAMRNFCDRAIWIHEGKIVRNGTPEEIVKEYEAFMYYDYMSMAQSAQEGPSPSRSHASPQDVSNIDWEALDNYECFGDGRAEIRKAALYSESPFEKLTILSDEEWANLFLQIESHDNIDFPIIGFIIFDKYGNHIMGTNTYITEKRVSPLSKGQMIMARFRFKIPHLKNGKYTLSPAIACGTQQSHVQLHWVHDACIFDVANKSLTSTQSWTFPIREVDFELVDIELP